MIGSTNIKHGGTKSIMIISVDSGSTVAIYSDAACTTLVKNAFEKSSGEFWITNLDNEDYYIKATNSDNTMTTILPYEITEYGVYRINIIYVPDQVVHYTMLYDGSLGDATLNQCPSVTGGYVATSYYHNNEGGNGTPTLTFNTSNMYYKMTAPSSGTKRASVFTTQGIANIDDYILFGIKHYFHHTKNASAVYDMVRITPSPVYGENPYTPAKVFIQITGATDVNALQTAPISIDDNEYLQFIMWSTTNHTYEGNIYDMFICKADDTETLATELSLSNNTTDTILASSSDINILLGSEKAVRWMCALCTGDFMAKAVQTEAFVTAYVSSPYKSIIDANEHWAKFLAMVA